MAPMASEFRHRGRTEPTDMQKTARIAMIRRRQSAQRLGLGNAWPNQNNVNPAESVAFVEESGAETWQRPEPNPLYQQNFNNNLKNFETKSYKEEVLELELKALNADIESMEASGQVLTADNETVKEAISKYNELNAVRGQLNKVGNEISSGIETDYRSDWWVALPSSVVTAIAIGTVAWYIRRRPRRSGGPRYIGTKDRLSIFGNF